MKGTTKKEGSSWYYVVDLGKGPDGKRIRKKKRGFKTKKEAEAALAKVVNEINTGTYIEPVKMLYKDFLAEHLENKKNSIKKQSHYNYRMIAEAYLNPNFGHLTVQQLNAMVIQRFVNELTNKGLSGAYIKKILDVLNSSLEKAKMLELIAKNPLELVERPRVQRQEMTVWDADEVSLFLKQAQEDRLYIAFLLAITTGMRQGEILGLRWRDIDFDSSILTIRQTLSHDGKELQAGAKTKSSIRSVHLPAETLKALKKHRHLVVQEKLIVGTNYTDYDLVVCTSLGTPVIPRNLNRTWKRLIRESGVNQIRFHDLRHTHATLLLKQGVHIKVVSERLGHSDTRMTLDTYSHVHPTMQAEAASAISAALFQKAK